VVFGRCRGICFENPVPQSGKTHARLNVSLEKQAAAHRSVSFISIAGGSLDRRRCRRPALRFFVIGTACSTGFSPQTLCIATRAHEEHGFAWMVHASYADQSVCKQIVWSTPSRSRKPRCRPRRQIGWRCPGGTTQDETAWRVIMLVATAMAGSAVFRRAEPDLRRKWTVSADARE
jgi:hypothetical protein